MELLRNVGSRNRVVRIVLAVVLAVVAVGSLRRGKRIRGVLAGVGALALGYSVTAGSGELTETLDIGTTGEDTELRCAVCGEPIRPGERRGPNANDEIVHEACKVSAE